MWIEMSDGSLVNSAHVVRIRQMPDGGCSLIGEHAHAMGVPMTSFDSLRWRLMGPTDKQRTEIGQQHAAMMKARYGKD